MTSIRIDNLLTCFIILNILFNKNEIYQLISIFSLATDFPYIILSSYYIVLLLKIFVLHYISFHIKVYLVFIESFQWTLFQIILWCYLLILTMCWV